MGGVCFLITLSEFSARSHLDNLEKESIKVNAIEVRTKLLPHLRKCLGCRVDCLIHSTCYVINNEPFFETNEFRAPQYEERLTQFIKETDQTGPEINAKLEEAIAVLDKPCSSTRIVAPRKGYPLEI